ncbi:MAG: antibiotic biosynthesis monooxygenase [Humibacillus sp.]|nr:antibiotic biosynthesis monooxygenase [Humibacillus sp.]MDN5779061.1 antibiotic biosynthesis monooxygenase [Humibacillus sp.]
MLIVAGHLIVDQSLRESYLADCVSVIEQARRAPGCLDFSISADPVVPGRINIFERWESQAQVETFRGDGATQEQRVAMLTASVSEYDVTGIRALT